MFGKDKIRRVNIGRWALILTAITVITLIALPVLAADGQGPVGDKGAQDLPGVLAGLLIIAGLGFALGCLGLVVNHIFHRRALVVYIFMSRKPGLSLLTGIIITLVVFGLMVILQSVPQLQGLILLIALIGLGLFTMGAVSRLAAQIVEPRLIEDDLPGTWAHIKGGLVLMAMNIILIVGNALFIGVLLAGIGATLLSYFTGVASLPPAPGEKPPASGGDEDIPPPVE